MAPKSQSPLRKRPQQERAQATVDAIVEATSQILTQEGYDALTTNKVAERAQVSVGAVYQYFPNKEALIRELVDRYSTFLFDMVRDQLSSLRDAKPKDVVRTIVCAMISIKRQSPQLTRVLREELPRVGRVHRYEEEMANIVTLVEGYARAHRDQLRVAPEVGAFVVTHMIDALSHAAVTLQAPADDEVLAEAIVEAAVRYALTDAALAAE
jgi:AcrR family transcriptional regulator